MIDALSLTVFLLVFVILGGSTWKAKHQVYTQSQSVQEPAPSAAKLQKPSTLE